MTAVLFLTVALLTIYNANLGESQFEEPVPFPPAPPTADNLATLCYNGKRRHKYPVQAIPSTWSSHFRRRATAISRLESWYHFCCSAPVMQPDSVLCCTKQAWMQALSQFCVEEFSTMTAAYDCCRHQGLARWKCFSTETFNPGYNPTLEYETPFTPYIEGFVFRNDKCQ